MPRVTYRPITNPVTRDRCLVLHESARELRIRFWIAPGSSGAPLHFHRSMIETFTVVEGAMSLELDRRGAFTELQAGSSVTIEPGRLHSFSNRHGAEWLVFEASLQPPARFLGFLLGFYGLAGAGKVRADGTPRNPVALLRLLNLGDVWLPGVPLLLQRGLFRLAELLSRWSGLEAELLGFAPALLRSSAGQEPRP